jgi:23S rRNA (cytosine1962-C5)-methyltransferase
MDPLNGAGLPSPSSQLPEATPATRSPAADAGGATPREKKIVVREPGKHAIHHGHPWLRRSSLAGTPAHVSSGDEVVLVDREGNRCGRGIYNADSQISVRVYSREPNEAFSPSFWHQRLEQAVQLRRQLKLLHPDGACRLVYSEADQLSGLIVDQYADLLVISVTALAMVPRWPLIAQWFQESFRDVPIRCGMVRTDPNMLRQEAMPELLTVFQGALPTAATEFHEAGLRFQVDPVGGQKTGFYLDQRVNRALFGQVAGGRVLDICCYTGGFSLAAAKNPQTTSVTAVDSSLVALEQAERHAALNQVSGIDFVKADCFAYLLHLKETGQRFDTVVLDPPKFAGRQQDVNNALQAYQRLNRLAMDCLQPGGILMTCSCSGRVLSEDFLHAVMLAGRKAGRAIQVLTQSGASPDHPVLLSCPETQYLKCVLCRVL